MQTRLHSIDEIRAWLALPAAAPELSPLGERPWLLLNVDAGAHGDSDRIADWLRRVPVPTIGVGMREHAPGIADACDACVDTLAQAQPLIAGIEQAPIAASVFTGLLRATAQLDLESALFAESLAYSTLQSGPEFARWRAANPPGPSAVSDPGPAVVATRDGGTLALELNRPSNRNGMSVEMRDALIEALGVAACDDSVHRVAISGRGKCFSTGGDLTEFGTAPDPATAHVVRTLALPGRALAACASRAEVRVHGACVGSGIEFPAFAARITATRDAWFQLPELKFGLIPGAGGCVSLPRRIGRQRTAWLVLSGKRVDAPTALDWGLVDALAD